LAKKIEKDNDTREQLVERVRSLEAVAVERTTLAESVATLEHQNLGWEDTEKDLCRQLVEARGQLSRSSAEREKLAKELTPSAAQWS
jgi:chromosome segregation ATPase